MKIRRVTQFRLFRSAFESYHCFLKDVTQFPYIRLNFWLYFWPTVIWHEGFYLPRSQDSGRRMRVTLLSCIKTPDLQSTHGKTIALARAVLRKGKVATSYKFKWLEFAIDRNRVALSYSRDIIRCYDLMYRGCVMRGSPYIALVHSNPYSAEKALGPYI